MDTTSQYSENFWFIFLQIQPGCRYMLSKSQYSGQMLENAEQENIKYGHFSRSYGSFCLDSAKHCLLTYLNARGTATLTYSVLRIYRFGRFRVPDFDTLHYRSSYTKLAVLPRYLCNIVIPLYNLS